jgi:hypothetical protein
VTRGPLPPDGGAASRSDQCARAAWAWSAFRAASDAPPQEEPSWTVACRRRERESHQRGKANATATRNARDAQDTGRPRDARSASGRGRSRTIPHQPSLVMHIKVPARLAIILGFPARRQLRLKRRFFRGRCRVVGRTALRTVHPFLLPASSHPALLEEKLCATHSCHS